MHTAVRGQRDQLMTFSTALAPDMRFVLEAVYREDRAKEVWV